MDYNWEEFKKNTTPNQTLQQQWIEYNDLLNERAVAAAAAAAGAAGGRKRIPEVEIDTIKVFAKFGASFKTDNNGTTWGWGYSGEYGLLGNNEISEYDEGTCTPVAVCGNHAFCNISVGMNNVLALDSSGQAWGWGYAFYARLGNNDGFLGSIDKSTPVAVCGNHTFCEISLDVHFSAMAIDNNGQAWGWGWNTYGQLGIGEEGPEFGYSTPVAVCGNHTFCKISGSQYSYVAIDNLNKIWTWGAGILGTGGEDGLGEALEPVRVCEPYNITEISFNQIGGNNGGFAVGVDPNGQAWGWGNNNHGQLGNNDSEEESEQSTPVAVCGNHTFCKIDSSESTSIALDSNGQAWCWGLGDLGQLGNNEETCESTPVAVCGGHTFSQIGTTEGETSYAIDTTGQAWAWGKGEYGELGDNGSGEHAECTPVAVCGEHLFIDINGGYQFAIGLDTNGQAWGWGYNYYGNLGNNDSEEESEQSTPVAVCGNHTFCNIDVAGSHVCAIDNNGQAWGWGYNIYGELGNNDSGEEANQSTPVVVYGSHTFCKIKCAETHSVALDVNGQVWCWGGGTDGELGNNLGGEYLGECTPVAVCGNHTFCEVGAGTNYSFAIDINGYAWSWGAGSYGQLGNNASGKNSDRSTPVAVCREHIPIDRHSYTKINGGDSFVIALDTNNRAWGWGLNEYGQLGINLVGEEADRSTPVAVCGNHTFIKIAGALTDGEFGGFAFALDSDGQAWGWGYGQYGQLGNNKSGEYDPLLTATPVAVYGEHSFIDISGAGLNGAGVDSDGQAWGWGLGVYGQLGNNLGGEYLGESTPVAVCGNHTFCEIVVGLFSMASIDTDNQIWCWGQNDNGELGNNTIGEEEYQSTPVAVCGNHTFCKVTAGVYYYIALDNNGQAWGWGQGSYGKLGNNKTGEYDGESTPVAVCGNHTFCQVDAGQNHTLALDVNGQAWAWGEGYHGQLGDNSFPEHTERTPVAVCGNHTFCEIGTSKDASYGIDLTGQIWSWGEGQYGGLGNNTSHEGSARSTPVAVCIGEFSERKNLCYTEITSGYKEEEEPVYNCSIVLDSEGQAWGWGYNEYGQLGPGNPEEPICYPTAIPGNHTFCKIRTGFFHTIAIDNHGQAWGWGSNFYGELGNNVIEERVTSPIAVCGNHTFCDISVGLQYTMAVDTNAQAWGWGWNAYGTLGDGTTINHSTPVSI